MKYLVWGTGLRAEELFISQQEGLVRRGIEIIGFIDNNIEKKQFHNIPVYLPCEIESLDYDYIDIWVIQGKEEIEQQIKEELNIPKNKRRNIFNEYIEKLTPEYEKTLNKSGGFKKPSLELLSVCVDRYEAQQWYKSAYKNFEIRKHAFLAYEWIRNNIKRELKILEVACGAGGMLYHLHEDGYESLVGYDIDERAVNAAVDIKSITGGKIEFYVDNARNPQVKTSYDVVVWVNGMYHLPEFRLNDFLDKHLPMVKERGYLVFDMVDSKYNEIPQNEYLTSDWNKEGVKRPTEYKLRMSAEEIEAVANNYGLRVIERYDAGGKVPRAVYILRR